MSYHADALAQVLFNKPSLQECSLHQVEYLANQYPYFSTAQLLLLKKTEKESEVYTRQLQQTALHFSNPLQLQVWLEEKGSATETPDTELFQKPMPESIETAPEGVTETTNTEETPVQKETETGTVAEIKNAATNSTESIIIASEPKSEPIEAIEKEAEKNHEPAETAPISFEPYHTVDYFASQGIKLSQQEATNDKLGKQLKSFTEWLKTMKRLPETKGPQTTDATGEHKVENLAAHSLDTADVITESMAEVWLKQGAKEKALDIYNKLRLRHPDKSAYFAAKIDALKQT